MKKIKILNKKAGGMGVEEWLKQIPYFILTIVVMGAIYLLVSTFVNISINVKPVQQMVLYNRIMYSPNSIMYMDNVTGRAYPGVIDLDKFSDETLDKAIKYSYERHISAKLEVFNSQNKVIKTAYLNKVWYNRLQPLAASFVFGPGSARFYPRTIPIVYRMNNANRPGFLRIEIIIPR